MGTVRGVCAILLDGTAQPSGDMKKKEKGLINEKVLKGGSKYSGIFIFKISIFKLIFLRNTKNGHFDQKN